MIGRSTGFRVRQLLALCATVLIAVPGTGLAQSWEVHAGLATAREYHRGATDVRYCTGGGVATVGTQRPGTATPTYDNLLVQRLNPNDATTPVSWRYTYDNGRPEQGAEIVEYTDGSGFAVVGTTDSLTSPAVSHLTVSKIDCGGNMVWRRSYGATAGINAAWDIIRANTGDPLQLTNPGDLVALGEYTANGLTRVRVVRINGTTGNLVWMRDYGVATGAQLYGRGIAEVDTPSLTDDLVVAGGIGNSAAIFQINGNDGSFVCGAQLAGLGVSRFNDIAAHGGSGIAPGFTPVGETRTTSAALPQIFVASFRSTNCGLQRQIEWGSPNQSETANAVTTTRSNTLTGVPAGQLLIAGNLNGPYGGVANSQDAWAHVMVPISLTPYTAGGYTGRRYGTQGVGLSGIETAAGIAESALGTYLVGSTSSNWTGSGDPMQALTVRMDDGFMNTLCSVPWSAPVLTLTPNVPLTVGGPQYNQQASLPVLPRVSIPQGFCCGISP